MKRPKEIWRRKEKLIKLRGSRCENCKKEFGYHELEVDHAIALSDGGDDSDSNVQLLCEACHLEKTICQKISSCWIRHGIKVF